jgi:hypothetical protein
LAPRVAKEQIGVQKAWYPEMQGLKTLAEFRWHKLAASGDHRVGLFITYTRA